MTLSESMQRFHGDDEEALVDGVYLSEESLTQITRLFKVRKIELDPAGGAWQRDYHL